MEFTIDRATWRCGDISVIPENRHGEGETFLLNEDGCMCCLGQISIQLGAKQEWILNKYTPKQTQQILNPLTYKDAWDMLDNTVLASEAMAINDDEETTREQKEKLLTELFKKSGHTLAFIGDYLATPSQSAEELG